MVINIYFKKVSYTPLLVFWYKTPSTLILFNSNRICINIEMLVKNQKSVRACFLNSNNGVVLRQKSILMNILNKIFDHAVHFFGLFDT